MELVVPGLGQSKCCWRLLTSFIQLLGSLVYDLERIDAQGWDANGVQRQKLEYQLLAVNIISIFFDKNYNMNLFTHEVSSTDGQLDRVSMTQNQASNIIKSLYKVVRAVHKLNSQRLNAEHKESIKQCVFNLNKSVPNMIEQDLENVIAKEEQQWTMDKIADGPNAGE